MADTRNYSILSVWAAGATTIIPATPVSGVVYRDTAVDTIEFAQGWPFDTLVDSKDFNQKMFLITSLLQELDQQGLIGWNDTVDYGIAAMIRGSDNAFYVSTAANGPATVVHDPVGDISGTWITLTQSIGVLDIDGLPAGTPALPDLFAFSQAGVEKQGTLTDLLNLGGGASQSLQNLIINGNMRIDQRGGPHVGLAVGNSGYTLDRFTYGIAGTPGAVVTVSQDTAVVPAGEAYSLKIDVTTADAIVAAGDIIHVRTILEGLDSSGLDLGKATAKQFTLRFKVRSPKTGVHCVSFQNDLSDRSFIKEYTVNVADTWEEKTMTITGDLIGTWEQGISPGLKASWALHVGSTFQGIADTWQAGNLFSTVNQVNVLDNVANNFYLADVELVEGTVTGAQMRPFGIEKSLAQRYFAILNFGMVGAVMNTTEISFASNFLTEMRVPPTITLLDSTPTFLIAQINISGAGSAIVVSSASEKGTNIRLNGFVALTTGEIVRSDQTNSMFSINSEL